MSERSEDTVKKGFKRYPSHHDTINIWTIYLQYNMIEVYKYRYTLINKESNILQPPKLIK